MLALHGPINDQEKNEIFSCFSRLANVCVTGLALALRTMKKGEFAQVMVFPQYAFGPMGCPPRIPQNATILYEVELLQFVDAVEMEDYSHDDQVKLAFKDALQVCIWCW